MIMCMWIAEGLEGMANYKCTDYEIKYKQV